MKTLKEFGRKVFNIYMGVGIIAMALLALLVGYTVIMRYCFSKSWKELSEFITTLFAFTTFWGMGINVIKGEHVMIDVLYNALRPGWKRIFAIIDYVIILIVDLIFTYQGFLYTFKNGKTDQSWNGSSDVLYVWSHAIGWSHLWSLYYCKADNFSDLRIRLI